MEEVKDFFQKLFDTQDWPPRWLCGKWTEFHGWLYIISDLIIWLSYFAIPFFLLGFIHKKKDIPLPRVFWLFGTFILMCGLTHLMDAIIFWWPAYRLSALLRFITASVSLLTVIALFQFFSQALKLKTSAEFERELKHRKKVEEELKSAQRKQQESMILLKEKNKEIQQFAYIVSHDLQEPLRTVSGMLSLLKEHYSAKPDEEADQYFLFMDEATHRMKMLITGLLDYSRLGYNHQPVEVDCHKLVNSVLDDLSIKIKEKQAVIEVDSLPRIYVYETELRLLFQNLINNALKFSRSGIRPVIHIFAEEKAEYWLFNIQDNGIGIDEKYREKIFIMFQRLHHSDDYEGTGIGLAHCKKVAEIHRGKIWVEPAPEQGSLFRFTISKKLKDE